MLQLFLFIYLFAYLFFYLVLFTEKKKVDHTCFENIDK